MEGEAGKGGDDKEEKEMGKRDWLRRDRSRDEKIGGSRGRGRQRRGREMS